MDFSGWLFCFFVAISAFALLITTLSIKSQLRRRKPGDFTDVMAARQGVLMQLVRQRGQHDCGVAAIAMVANVSYEHVLACLIRGLSPGNSLNQLAILRTLQHLTQAEWREVNFCWPLPVVRDFLFPEVPMVVVIERADGSRHCVAASGDLVYDPLFEVPFCQRVHPERGSKVLTIFIEERRQGQHQ
jgi:hypothetical protein